MKKWFWILSFAAVIWAAVMDQAFAGPADLAYFQQFIYRVDDITTDPDYPKQLHRMLLGFDVQRGGVPVEGRGLFQPRVTLFLFSDFTYLAIYNEIYWQEGNLFYPGACKTIRGKWSVPEDKLLIDDWGVGERHFAHGQNRVMLKFVKPLAAPQAVGYALDTAYGQSEHGPEEHRCFPF